MSKSGLTLIEVLISLVIVAVGVLGAAAMQASSLSASGRASIVREATRLAESELELQRGVVRSDCHLSDALPGAYSCEVEVTACALSELGLVCDGSTPAIADLVEARVEGPRNISVSVAALVKR